MLTFPTRPMRLLVARNHYQAYPTHAPSSRAISRQLKDIFVESASIDKPDSFEETREAKKVRWGFSWRYEGYQRTCGINTGYLSVRLRALVVVLQALTGHTYRKKSAALPQSECTPTTELKALDQTCYDDKSGFFCCSLYKFASV